MAYASKIRTLLLYSRGCPTRRNQIKQSVLHGAFKLSYEFRAKALADSFGGSNLFRRLFQDGYSALGYVNDWRDAFINHPALRVFSCNISNLIEYHACLRNIGEFDLIVVLHSAFGDDVSLLQKTANLLARRKCRIAVFVGNEYILMREKRAFIEAIHADYVCTQLPLATGQFLYGDIAGIKVIEMPHALNPDIFFPCEVTVERRKIGFIGARYPNWIGDSERNTFFSYCIETIAVEQGDFSIGRGNRSREHWADFLRGIGGTIGAEAGTYFLDRESAILSASKRFLSSGILEEEFDSGNYAREHHIEYVSGKAISSRHFEALGTKTVQLLLEGDYNGILQPDVHYLSIRKDLSNFEQAVSIFMDLDKRKEMANLAFEFAMDCHTYAHRVNHFLKEIDFC